MTISANRQNVSLDFAISHTTGGLATGLTTADILSAYYRRDNSAAVEITPLSDLSDFTDAHADGGFIEDPEIPGTYRFDVPDAAFASGAEKVKIQLNMAVGLVATPWLIDLGSTSATTSQLPIAIITPAAIEIHTATGLTLAAALTRQTDVDVFASVFVPVEEDVGALGTYRILASDLANANWPDPGTNFQADDYWGLVVVGNYATATTASDRVTDIPRFNFDGTSLYELGPLTSPDAGSTEIARAADLTSTLPVNQVPVPESRKWVAKRTSADGVVGEQSLSVAAGSGENLWACDFRKLLPTNGRLSQINSTAILSGTEDGVTFPADLDEATDYGVDRSEAHWNMTPVTAGTYVLRLSVDYAAADGGGSEYCDVTLVVTE